LASVSNNSLETLVRSAAANTNHSTVEIQKKKNHHILIDMKIPTFTGIYKYVWILVAIMIINCLYVWFTPFTRTITIKEKYDVASGSGRYLSMKNTVMDSEGRVYAISNSLPLLHFTSAEVMMKIEKGATYTVQGYGWRVPIFGMFPNITDVK